MGKYALLVVIAAALGSAVLASQGMETDMETGEDQAARQEKVLAREIATSAFDMGMSELRRDFSNWRVERQHVDYKGGAFDLEATGPASGPVSLTAIGQFGAFAYEIVAEAKKDTSVSSIFNGITAQTPIDFDLSGGGCSGGPCISGVDAGGGDDRHGVSLPPGEDTDAVCEEFDGAIEGKESGCDVVSRSSERDEWVEGKVNELESEIQAARDAGNPEITVCDGCKVGSLADTSGILYVTGELRFNGEEQWDGLVFVSDGGSVRVNGGGDVRNINGGLVLSDSTSFNEDEEFDMNGGNSVKYNSSMLEKFMNTLPSMMSASINERDRSGRWIDN